MDQDSSAQLPEQRGLVPDKVQTDDLSDRFVKKMTGRAPSSGDRQKCKSTDSTNIIKLKSALDRLQKLTEIYKKSG